MKHASDVNVPEVGRYEYKFIHFFLLFDTS